MNNLINTVNNCTIKTITVQYRQQQYNTTKHEVNMNNLINTQQLYNKDNNSTIPLNMR